ncbi:hypothetical protein V6B95_05375 [Thermoanaerobacterium saccharolyticum]
MLAKKETSLTKQDNGFLRLADFNMAGMMAEELDGLDMSFERIKIPSAGSTVFEVPGENPGEPDTVKEFSAVIPIIIRFMLTIRQNIPEAASRPTAEASTA